LNNEKRENRKIFEFPKKHCVLPAAKRVGVLRMKNDFCKIIFHPQTPLVLNAKKLLLHGIELVILKIGNVSNAMPFHSLTFDIPQKN
jgi:hypothetical protein